MVKFGDLRRVYFVNLLDFGFDLLVIHLQDGFKFIILICYFMLFAFQQIALSSNIKIINIFFVKIFVFYKKPSIFSFL